MTANDIIRAEFARLRAMEDRLAALSAVIERMHRIRDLYETAGSPDAYESVTTHASPPVWTRVYLARGRYAHLAEATGCPTVYSHDDWYGTGTQDEHDRAAAMPLCPRCFAYREAQIPDGRLGTGHGTEMT